MSDTEPPVTCDCHIDGCRCDERMSLQRERDVALAQMCELMRQLDSIRLQFNNWRGGHVFDNDRCLLCGKPGPENAPQLCAMEMYMRQYKERA